MLSGRLVFGLLFVAVPHMRRSWLELRWHCTVVYPRHTQSSDVDERIDAGNCMKTVGDHAIDLSMKLNVLVKGNEDLHYDEKTLYNEHSK